MLLCSSFFFFNLFLFPSVAHFALICAVLCLPDFRSLLQCIVLNSSSLKCFQSSFAGYFHIWGCPCFPVISCSLMGVLNSAPNCAGHSLFWVIVNWMQSYSNLCIHLYSVLIHSIHAYFVNFVNKSKQSKKNHSRAAQTRLLKPNCDCEELDCQSIHLVRFSAIKH